MNSWHSAQRADVEPVDWGPKDNSQRNEFSLRTSARFSNRDSGGLMQIIVPLEMQRYMNQRALAPFTLIESSKFMGARTGNRPPSVRIPEGTP